MKLNILLGTILTLVFCGVLYTANESAGKVRKCRISCTTKQFKLIDGRCYCITDSILEEVK